MSLSLSMSPIPTLGPYLWFLSYLDSVTNFLFKCQETIIVCDSNFLSLSSFKSRFKNLDFTRFSPL